MREICDFDHKYTSAVREWHPQCSKGLSAWTTTMSRPLYKVLQKPPEWFRGGLGDGHMARWVQHWTLWQKHHFLYLEEKNAALHPKNTKSTVKHEPRMNGDILDKNLLPSFSENIEDEICLDFPASHSAWKSVYVYILSLGIWWTLQTLWSL